MNITPLYTFLAVVAALIVNLLIKNYWPSYFNTKGSNQATKEDIGEITTKVEEVKQIFAKETEAVKANLNILNNIQLGIVSEERNAIIEIHTTYYRYYNHLNDVSMGDIDRSSNDEITKWMKTISEQYKGLIDCTAKLELFVDDDSLLGSYRALLKETIGGLEKVGYETGYKIMQLNLEYTNTKQGLKIEEQVSAQQVYHRKLSDLLTVYRSQVLDCCKVIVPMLSAFQDISRKYLNRLLNNK